MNKETFLSEYKTLSPVQKELFKVIMNIMSLFMCNGTK